MTSTRSGCVSLSVAWDSGLKPKRIVSSLSISSGFYLRTSSPASFCLLLYNAQCGVLLEMVACLGKARGKGDVGEGPQTFLHADNTSDGDRLQVEMCITRFSGII